MIKSFFLLLTLFSTQLFAVKYVKWEIALDWKSTLTPLSSSAFKISEIAKKLSDNRFTINVSGLEKQQNIDLFQMVQDNKYQMIHANSSIGINSDINTIWATGIPLGMTSKEQNSWFYYGEGEKLISKVYDKFNLLSFPAGDLGAQTGGWFKKEIKKTSDFNGLNINAKGITSEILSMHYVNIKKISSSNISKAFLNGQLDVISGTSPSMDIKMGYHKIAPYYYTTWDKPSSQTQFLINKKAFEELPVEYRDILLYAIKIASSEMYNENFYESLKAWSKIQKDYPNIQIKTLPEEVLQDLTKSKKLIFEQYSKENKLFKEIYESQKDFLKKARQWSKIEEFSYIKSMNELENN